MTPFLSSSASNSKLMLFCCSFSAFCCSFSAEESEDVEVVVAGVKDSGSKVSYVKYSSFFGEFVSIFRIFGCLALGVRAVCGRGKSGALAEAGWGDFFGFGLKVTNMATMKRDIRRKIILAALSGRKNTSFFVMED